MMMDLHQAALVQSYSCGGETNCSEPREDGECLLPTAVADNSS